MPHAIALMISGDSFWSYIRTSENLDLSALQYLTMLFAIFNYDFCVVKNSNTSHISTLKLSVLEYQ